MTKKGKRKDAQQYRCKTCGKYFLQQYHIRRMNASDQRMLIKLLKRGNSIRGMADIIEVSHVTILRWIKKVAENVQVPDIEFEQSYQVDEMQTFIVPKRRKKIKGKQKKKTEWWIIYALNNRLGKVVGFVTGGRSKANIKPLIDELLHTDALKIYTDGLNLYPGLIPKSIHRTFERCTNKIERYNLTLRNHVKRLSRCTLGVSRSVQMLESSLKIYFWG